MIKREIQNFALYLDFESAKIVHVLKVLSWGYEGCWRFLTGVGILILIWIWSVFFRMPMLQIFALYLDFEGVKNIHAL